MGVVDVINAAQEDLNEMKKSSVDVTKFITKKYPLIVRLRETKYMAKEKPADIRYIAYVTVKWIKEEMLTNTIVDSLPIYIDLEDSGIILAALNTFIYNMYYELLKGNVGINVNNISDVYFLNVPCNKETTKSIIRIQASAAIEMFTQEMETAVNYTP